MNAVKVDESHRVWLPMAAPGDYYAPEIRGDDEIILRKVQPPRCKMTQQEVKAAIKRAGRFFTGSWDELKDEIR